MPVLGEAPYWSQWRIFVWKLIKFVCVCVFCLFVFKKSS